MRLMFVGNGKSDPEVARFGSYEFPINQWVDVRDDDFTRKLAANSHFAVEESGGPAVAESVIQIPERRGPGRPRRVVL